MGVCIAYGKYSDFESGQNKFSVSVETRVWASSDALVLRPKPRRQSVVAVCADRSNAGRGQ